MLSSFWRLLTLYLVLGAEGEGDAAGDAAGGAEADADAGTDEGTGDAASADDQHADADEGTGDATLDDLLDHVEDGETGGRNTENAAIREARRRAQVAEENLAAERTARQAAEQRAQQGSGSGATPDEQRVFDQEEAQLRAAREAGNADNLRWLEWQINSNRTMRANTRTSQQALFAAQDTSDRSAFERLEITKPKVYKRYAEKVEKAVADMRAKGQNAPRLAVLRLLIGDDILNGTIGAKTRKANAGADNEARGVDRGRTPGARTDVSGKGKLTDAQKRAAYWENQRI